MFRPIFIYFLLSSLLIFSILIIIFAIKLKIPILYSYLFAINLTLFLLYFYDKLSAKFSNLRVPEFILHFYALLGGTPLAFIAQKLFSHKTNKESFQSTFKKILFFQIFTALLFSVTIFYLA